MEVTTDYIQFLRDQEKLQDSEDMDAKEFIGLQLERECEVEMTLNDRHSKLRGPERLTRLKASVHQIIKNHKNSETNSKGLQTKLDDLQSIAEVLKSPENNMSFGNDLQISKFLLDGSAGNIVLVLENGMIGLIQLQEKRMDEQDPNKVYLTCQVYKTEEKIIDIEQVENDIYLCYSEKSLLYIVKTEESIALAVSTFFHNPEFEGRNLKLAEIKKSEQSGDIFFMFLRFSGPGGSNLFIRYKQEGVKVGFHSRKAYFRKVDFFVNFDSNHDLIFLVRGKQVFQISISSEQNDSEEQYLDEIHPLELQSQEKTEHGDNSMQFFQFTSAQRVDRKPFFENIRNDIRDFAFDEGDNFFFVTDGTLIKKFSVDSKILEQSYVGHREEVKGFKFSQDYNYIFSFDEDDIINIWNNECGSLQTSLNQHSMFYDIKDLQVDGNSRQMMVLHEEGIYRWIVDNSAVKFGDEQGDLSHYCFVVLKGGKEMWIGDGIQYSLFNLNNKNKILMQSTFPRSMRWYELLSNGDLIFVCSKANEDQTQFSLLFQDIYKFENGEQSSEASTEHLHSLFETEEEIFSTGSVTNRGLDADQLYEFKKIIQSDYFQTKYGAQREVVSFIEVYFTLKSGAAKCATVLFDQEDQIISKTIEDIFTHFRPNQQSTLSGKEHFGKAYDTEMTEFRGMEEPAKENSVQSIRGYWTMVSLGLEICVFSESKQIKQKANKHRMSIVVWVRQQNKLWTCSRFSAGIVGENEKNEFFFSKMDSEITPNNDIRFFINYEVGVLVLKYDFLSDQVSLVSFLEKTIDIPVVFSEKLDSFCFAVENSVQIYDSRLRVNVYTFDTDADVEELSVRNTGTEMLLVYDDKKFTEINLESLETVATTSIFNNQEDQLSHLPFYREYFEEGEMMIIPLFRDLLRNMSITSKLEELNLNTFPFEALLKCFDKDDYFKPVLDFAQYYFLIMQERNMIDSHYGPLNPILFAIYHRDMFLLERILQKYYYPQDIQHYWSPLSFACKFEHHSAVRVICDYLANKDYQVNLSRVDYLHLLQNQSKPAQILLASLPTSPGIQNFPRLLNMDGQIDIYYSKSIHEFLTDLRFREKWGDAVKLKNDKLNKKLNRQPTEKEDTSHQNQDAHIKQYSVEELEQEEDSGTKFLAKKEANVYSVPFKIDFSAGSQDSIRFLEVYSNSETEEFVNSNWKQIILNKWNIQRWIHIIYALLYLLLTFFLVISLVFPPKNSKWSSVSSLVLIFLFIVFELFQLVSYCFFDFSKYILNLWNWVDWSINILLLVYFFGYEDQPDSKANQIIAPIALLLVLYRCFSQMRVIDAFTSLIDMINIIIQKIGIFFIILFYFYFSTAFLMIRLLPEQSTARNFEVAYLWTLFGSVEADDFSSSPYITIAILFGTIIVTIILLNLLIAYLSNVFSRLEEQQNLQDLKEKTEMLLNMEVILWFFRFKLTGQDTALYAFDALVEKDYVRRLSNEETIENSNPKPKGLENRKFFYIFKALELDEETRNVDSKSEELKKLESLNSYLYDFETENKKQFQTLLSNLQNLKLKTAS